MTCSMRINLDNNYQCFVGYGLTFPDFSGRSVVLPAEIIEDLSDSEIIKIVRDALPYSNLMEAWFITGNISGYRLDSLTEIQKILSKLVPYKEYKRINEAILVLETAQNKFFKKGIKRTADKTLRRLILERDQHICRYCGKPLMKEDSFIDHVVPYSLGGKTEYNNLVTSCLLCNSKKGGRPLEECNMQLQPVGVST